MPYFPPAAVIALTSQSAALGADVTLTSANTYFDGPTISLAAGTWLIIGSVTILSAGTIGLTAKLWDGTTVFASGETEGASAVDSHIGGLAAIVTPGTTTTYKISVAATAGTTTKIKAAATDNGAGNNASFLVAVKIA